MLLSNAGSVPEASEHELKLRIKIAFQSGLRAKHRFPDNCVYLCRSAFPLRQHRIC